MNTGQKAMTPARCGDPVRREPGLGARAAWARWARWTGSAPWTAGVKSALAVLLALPFMAVPWGVSRAAANVADRPAPLFGPGSVVAVSPGASPLSMRMQTLYRQRYGIDGLAVKMTASGRLVRFTWRVTDPEKAKPLHDKKVKPLLIDHRSSRALQVPEMEQVGQLRQTAAPGADRGYWMIFSNTQGTVQKGDRVDVVIGNARLLGLTVQ